MYGWMRAGCLDTIMPGVDLTSPRQVLGMGAEGLEATQESDKRQGCGWRVLEGQVS